MQWTKAYHKNIRQDKGGWEERQLNMELVQVYLWSDWTSLLYKDLFSAPVHHKINLSLSQIYAVWYHNNPLNAEKTLPRREKDTAE